MAVTNTSFISNRGVKVATVVDTAGGGTAVAIDTEGYDLITVQRVSGSGTYTVTGSLNGTNFAALPTAVSAIATDVLTIVTGQPRQIKVAIAAAAATVVVSMLKTN